MSHESFQAPELAQLAALLPNLEFQTFIAQGGMGAVYRARQRSLDRDVAVKILPRELGADPEFHASFEVEAKAMARLNHPNLISVYDFGDVDGMPYIVMEYVDGKSLYHSAWNKQIDPKVAVEIVAGICRGLAHAHESGVIHRDIKPANILLTPKAEPKIGDFGLARPAGHDGPGLVMGTPGYSAPEFLEDYESADERADLYAVGVILHELVTGQRPDLAPGEERKPTGNLRLDKIWRKATETDPNRRYASAAEMAAELEGWLRNPGPKSAGPPPPAATSPTPKLAATPRTPGRPLPGKPLPGNPAAGKPGAAPAPQVAMSSGSNWAIIRNLLIIAVLLVAIGFAWKAYEGKKKENAEKKARYEREQYEARKQAELEARRRAEEARRNAQKPPTPPPPDVEPPKVETPMETLERLRTELARGGRAEMPKGTIRKGERDFFVVEKPLSWHEAAAFAEDHGGYLAIVHSTDDITGFEELVPENGSLWIGAGRSVGGRWVNIDGTDWSLAKDPPGAGNYATINGLGLLRARRRTDRFPFIIEWRRDGSNPATLAAMLGRTRETLDAPNPNFPPGTESQDARYFSIIRRDVERREAEKLARQAGGILAVPATEIEADWLESRVAELDAPKGFWLGASREGEVWTWDTGEEWKFARWGADAGGNESALVLMPGDGWHDADPEETASGFIIEWSKDAEAAEARPEDLGNADPGLAELRTKAGELVEQAIKERDDKLAANARTFSWDLDVWFRGLNFADREAWKPHVDGLKAMVQGNRVPAPEQFGADNPVQLSPQMGKVCTYCYTKQQEIDEAHESKLGRLRDAYVTRLLQSANEARERGQGALADKLQRFAADAEDLDAWVDSMTD
ncbi:protein kinase [Haloferula sp. A504]|uniref:protein kinase domain-containing protein n=1 Tax=Haloferula sp. A504 TaxID=3373601 RepID=UPI0031BCF427|nr:protein kinase [Verrucomicrobiaceae bacterium E54]